jgi:hypothetical protein
MYNIVKTNDTLPTCMSKWMSIFEIIQLKDWNHIFGMPFSITKDSTLQWFQFRIIHRIIGTNYLLYQINYKSSAECSFCHSVTETIEHIFWECKYVKMFIAELFKGFEVFADFINAPSFILGHKNTSVPKNRTFLLTKKFIYICKMNKKTPTVIAAKSYFSIQYNILKDMNVFCNLDSNPITSNKEWDILLSLYR